MYIYNEKYMRPPLSHTEITRSIESVGKKEYRYKCKLEPIVSFCNAKLCSKREFGVGDDVPPPEITEIRKYTSDPPIYFVSIDGESVEVDNATIHDAEKFSMACMDQISRPMLPIGKIIWRKQLVKLFANVQEVKAPDSSKIDVQLKDLLTDFISKSSGKEIQDVLRGLPFSDPTDKKTYFKFKDFWKYLQRTKSWPDKTYPRQKTLRLLDQLFEAKEEVVKIENIAHRVLKMETIKLDKPNIRQTKLKKASFE